MKFYPKGHQNAPQDDDRSITDIKKATTKDLKEYHKELIKERTRCETYSERVEVNKIMRNILEELEKVFFCLFSSKYLISHLTKKF